MSKETLRMSGRERRRLVELEAVARGEQRLSQAAERLGMSYRQAKRLGQARSRERRHRRRAAGARWE